MARTATSRHALGLNNIALVGNSNLNLSTSYLEIVSPMSGNNYTNFDPSSDKWTVSFWSYITHTGATADWNYAISLLSQTDSNGGSSSSSGAGTGRGWVSSAVGSGKYSCNLGNGNRIFNVVPTINTWEMITLVYDNVAQTLQLYVNTTAYDLFTGVTGFESCTGKMRFGANRGTVRSMDGYIEKPRLIKGVAATSAQISGLYHIDAVPGTAEQKEFEIIGCTGSGVPVDTGINSYTLTFNNSAAVNTNQSFFRLPPRTPVTRTPVNRTPA